MPDFYSKLPVIIDSSSTIGIISTGSTIPVSFSTTATIPVSFATTSTVQAVTAPSTGSTVEARLISTTATIPVIFSDNTSTVNARLISTTATIPVSFATTSTVQAVSAPSSGSTVEANIRYSKTLLHATSTLIQQSHTVVDLAAGSGTRVLLFAASGTTFIRTLHASASGAFKVSLIFGTSTVYVGFGTSANPNVYVIFDPPLHNTTSNSTISVELVNRENAAMNVYATYLGWY